SIRVVSEMALGLSQYRGRVIGVTGTNGKSTVTQMCAWILQQLNKDAVACGNIGLPVCDVVSRDQYPEVLVVELSSYQLHQSPPLSMAAAVMTNFGFDHQEYHGTQDEYRRAKERIFLAAE